MITFFNVQSNVIQSKNIYKFCDNRSMFTSFLAQTNIQIHRQKNFNLSHGNTSNTNIIMKMRPFQLQQQQKNNNNKINK